MSISAGNFRHRWDDVDEVAVYRAIGGEDVRLTPPEGEMAVTELHAFGLSDGQIATRLHVAARTVFRIRHRLGLPANYPHGRPERRTA